MLAIALQLPNPTRLSKRRCRSVLFVGAQTNIAVWGQSPQSQAQRRVHFRAILRGMVGLTRAVALVMVAVLGYGGAAGDDLPAFGEACLPMDTQEDLLCAPGLVCISAGAEPGATCAPRRARPRATLARASRAARRRPAAARPVVRRDCSGVRVSLRSERAQTARCGTNCLIDFDGIRPANRRPSSGLRHAIRAHHRLVDRPAGGLLGKSRAGAGRRRRPPPGPEARSTLDAGECVGDLATVGQGCAPMFDGTAANLPACRFDPSNTRGRQQAWLCQDLIALLESDGFVGGICYYDATSHALVGAYRGATSAPSAVRRA